MQVPTDIEPGPLLSRHGRVGGGRLRQVLARLIPRLAIPADTSIDLHQHGVVVHRRGTAGGTFVPFMAMADLYLYRTGRRLFGPPNALAFRQTPEDEWVVALDHHGDGFRLRGEIIGGQLRERGPLALRALEAGDVLTFHAITDADRLASRTSGAVAFVDTSLLRLSSTGVDVDGTHIAIADISRLEEGGPDGSLRLFNAYGQMLSSMHTLSLFSADLFVVLMRTMIEAQHYGIAQKTAPRNSSRAADAG